MSNNMTKKFKNEIKKELINILRSEKEIQRIVLFGSFVHSDDPYDLDIAIFQNSNFKYLDLALKYRKLTRKISKKIPIDIIPIRASVKNGSFLNEIESGEIIYER